MKNGGCSCFLFWVLREGRSSFWVPGKKWFLSSHFFLFQIPNNQNTRKKPMKSRKNVRSERIRIIFSVLQISKRNKLLIQPMIIYSVHPQPHQPARLVLTKFHFRQDVRSVLLKPSSTRQRQFVV